MIVKHFSKLLCTSLLFASPLSALDCSSTKDIILYNGHYYTVTTDKLSFDVAKQVAENNGGYLAIPNTTTENGFIKGLIGGSTAWIGVWDPNYTSSYCQEGSGVCSTDPSRFKTVKNQTLTYSNWEVGQPDNFVREYDIVDNMAMVAPLGEHWGVMSGNSGRWADYGYHADSFNNPPKFIAVFEYDTKPECFMEDGALSADDFVEKKCNTSVWDETADVLTPGQTFNCLVDQYGTDYCPEALAPADTYWDYSDSYVVASTGTVVDYVDKVGGSTSLPNSGALLHGIFRSAYSEPDSIVGIMMLSFDASNIYVYAYTASITGKSCSVMDPANTNFSNPYTFGNYKATLPKSTSSPQVWIGYGYRTYLSYDATNMILSFTDNQESSNNFTIDFKNQSVTGNMPRFEFKNGALYALPHHFFQTTVYGSRNATVNGVNMPLSFGGSGPSCISNVVSGDRIWSTNSLSVISSPCPTGYTDNGTNCKKTVNYTYYNYLCSTGTAINAGGNCAKTDPNLTLNNTSTLDDPCNSSTPPPDNCKALKYTCNSTVREPAWVDNQWQCSPFPCIGESDVENLDASVGASDPDNGGWNENGGCDGQIYLFSGKGEKCRSWDMFFGLAGGGCCDKDKVFAGLVECKANEKLLAEKNRAEQCHYVGEFCSKKIKLGFIKICVQKSKGHCCFNSKLGRILQEQGRPQLDMGWGSGENPQCRGFTPEEFQKLDMSRIDFSEFLEDFEAVDMSNLGTSIANRVNNNLNAAFPQPQ